MKMDRWKYYWITHQYHTIMNPVDETRLDHFLDLLKLNRGASAVDFGSGKGEMLIRLVEKYDIKGSGIDKSPYSMREAEQLKKQRVPRSNLKFLEMDGAQYKPDHDFDLVMCIGASWIFGGYRNTVKALAKMTKPNGLVMIGEPYWRKEPPKEYLEIEELQRDSIDSHSGNALIAEQEGLRLTYSLDASKEAWDQYEGLHWYAADRYALSNPKDPDLKELLTEVSKYKESYLRWGRDTLGWAIYLFRRASSGD